MTLPARGRTPAVTVEKTLYLLALIVGATVRFGGLAARPLSSLEAWNAWSAWQTAAGLSGPSDLTSTSPLWHSAATLLFWFGADGDAWARSVAAAAGTALILAPWLLHRLMGRPAALMVSWLIALDPWLIVFSRLADGAMLSATLAFLLISAGVRVLTDDYRRPEANAEAGLHRGSLLGKAMAAGTGLFLVSGHMAWGFAPVLLAFMALNWHALRRSGVVAREAAPWLAVSAIAGATLGLTLLDGIGRVSASLTMWLDSALATGAPVPASSMVGGYALGWPLTRLLIDQPLLVVFGIGGLLYLQLRGSEDELARSIRWTGFLWLWLAWGVVLCLLPGRGPFSLLILVMPLLIGAAYALNALVERRRTYATSQETLILLLTVAVLSVSAVFWGVALVSNAAFGTASAQAVAVIVGLAIAIIILYGAWSSPRQALWVSAAALEIGLALGTVSSAWQLNHRSSPDRRDSLFREVGGEGVRQFVEDIYTISAHRAGNPQEIPIFVVDTGDVASPEESGVAFRTPRSVHDVTLGWYLRSMRRLTWGNLPPKRDVTRAAPLLVQIAEDDALDTPSPAPEYIGSDYLIRTAWLPDSLGVSAAEAAGDHADLGAWFSSMWTTAIQPRLRWALYRRAGTPPGQERVILWAERDGAETLHEASPAAN